VTSGPVSSGGMGSDWSTKGVAGATGGELGLVVAELGELGLVVPGALAGLLGGLGLFVAPARGLLAGLPELGAGAGAGGRGAAGSTNTPVPTGRIR